MSRIYANPVFHASHDFTCCEFLPSLTLLIKIEQKALSVQYLIERVFSIIASSQS